MALAEQTTNDQLLGVAHWHLGRSLMLLNRLDEALPHLETGLRFAERARDLRSVYFILLNLNLAHQSRGDLHAARGYNERALVLADQMSDPYLLAHVLNTHGFNVFLLGEWGQAREAFERSSTLFRQAGAPWGTGYPLANLGTYFMVTGHWEVAAPYFEEAQILAEQSQSRQLLRWMQSLLAERELVLGQPQAAQQRLAPLVAEGVSETGLMFARALLAWAHLDLGETTEAQRLLAEALAEARDQHQGLVLIDLLPVQARLAARLGRWQEAEQALAEALALAQHGGYIYGEAKMLHTAGLVACQQGNAARAIEQWQAALALFARLGERLYAGQAEAKLAWLDAATAPLPEDAFRL